MNAKSVAKAKAHAPRSTDVGDRSCQGEGSRGKCGTVSDRKGGERCALRPVGSEILSQRGCPPSVDVALRPFIVAVANAIIKDILRERRELPRSLLNFG